MSLFPNLFPRTTFGPRIFFEWFLVASTVSAFSSGQRVYSFPFSDIQLQATSCRLQCIRGILLRKKNHVYELGKEVLYLQTLYRKTIWML